MKKQTILTQFSLLLLGVSLLWMGFIDSKRTFPNFSDLPNCNACIDARHNFGKEGTITIKGVDIKIYNATESQKTKIINTLERLPVEHLFSIPRIILANESSGFLSRPEKGGAANRCKPPNLDLEYIKLSKVSFSKSFNKRTLQTLLHEIGHFVDRDYEILSLLTSREKKLLQKYLDEYPNKDGTSGYRGETKGKGEAIAQAYMYYFSRTDAVSQSPRVLGKKFPRYLLDILENSTAWEEAATWSY